MLSSHSCLSPSAATSPSAGSSLQQSGSARKPLRGLGAARCYKGILSPTCRAHLLFLDSSELTDYSNRWGKLYCDWQTKEWPDSPSFNPAAFICLFLCPSTLPSSSSGVRPLTSSQKVPLVVSLRDRGSLKKLGLKNLLHRRLLKGSANTFHCSINWESNCKQSRYTVNQGRHGELVYFTKRVSDLQAVDTQRQPVPCIWSLHKAADEGYLQMCSWCWPSVMEQRHQCWGNSGGPHACNDGFILCSSEGRLISFVHRHTGRKVFYCLTHRWQSGWKLASGGKIAENKMIVLKAT